MKYDDLEKSEDLFEIADVPIPIENIEMEGVNKDYLSNTEETTLSLDENEIISKKKKNNKSKKSLKEKWQNLSKKKKIIFISSGIIILIILIVVIVLLPKEEKEPEKKEPDKTPSVIVEKENYIYKDGNLSFIDKDNNEIGTYECKNKQEDLCYVENYNSESSLDSSKMVYEDGSNILIRSKIYNNKYVFIYDNAKKNEGVITLYNITDEKNEGVYKEIRGSIDSDYVILKNSNNKLFQYVLTILIILLLILNYLLIHNS